MGRGNNRYRKAQDYLRNVSKEVHKMKQEKIFSRQDKKDLIRILGDEKANRLIAENNINKKDGYAAAKVFLAEKKESDEYVGAVADNKEGYATVKNLEKAGHTKKDAKEMVFGRREDPEVLSEIPDEIQQNRQDILNWIDENSDRAKYKKVVEKFDELYTSGKIGYAMHNGKLEVQDYLTGIVYGPTMTAPDERKDKEGDCGDGENLYKKLSRYMWQSSWFYNTDMGKDQDLIYKDTIDQPAESEIGIQFRKQLKEDIYDKGYEWTKRSTYHASMEALFPGMKTEEQIMGMQLLTGFQGPGWFQEKTGEIKYNKKNGKLVFKNKLIGQNRSYIDAFDGLEISSTSGKRSNMAIMSSRSLKAA